MSGPAPDGVAYADAVPADGAELTAMATESFVATFGMLYAPADLATFLHAAFAQRLPAHLADPAYSIRLARAEGRVVGYAKIGPVAFPGEWPANAVELYQLYVLGAWQGTGVAAMLMDWAVDTARARGATELLLSVFVDNARARRFYERRGFVEIGRYTFMVGDHADDDRIMRLTL